MIGLLISAAMLISLVAAPRQGQLPPIPVADAASLGVPSEASDTDARQSSVASFGRADGCCPTAPQSGIGSPLEGRRGIATWYCCTRHHPSGLYAAAGPALRVGHWRGRVVHVCSPGGCVDVTLIDTCLCGHGRVIDLYPEAFRHLAPLSQGIVGVTVSWNDVTPPPTDTN